MKEHSDKPGGSEHKAAADNLTTFDYWTGANFKERTTKTSKVTAFAGYLPWN